MANDIVTFLDSRGRTISNDPRHNLKRFQDQVSAQEENLRAADDEDMPEDEAEADGLDDLTGKDLKKLAQAEDVDISGLTKVAQVREAIRAHREASHTDDEAEDEEEAQAEEEE